MADLRVCSHGKTSPCDECQLLVMLALRKQLDPDAPDMIVFPESVVDEDLIEQRLEFAADVSRNQQYRINELERIVKLLMGYVGHRGGCASYTNGPCTCGFESAMHDPAIAYEKPK